MIRRSNTTLTTLLGAAVTAAFLASCGTATTTATPTRPAVSAISPSHAASGSGAASGSPAASGSGAASGSPAAPASGAASGSPAASGSAASGSAAPSAGVSFGPHADAKLEDLLPSEIGGVSLEKFSLTLSAYIASPPTGGDKALYTPWLVKFGKIPDDVTMAVAWDPTGQENFNVRAIEVPGVDAATLSSSFGDVARAANWPVASHTNLMSTGKTVLEIVDPDAKAAGQLFAGYVYAKDDILYTIVTDDSSLLLEALIKLP